MYEPSSARRALEISIAPSGLGWKVKDPPKWVTFGGIYLSREKAVELGPALVDAGSPDLLDFKRMVVSLGQVAKRLSQAGRRRRAHGRIQRTARRKNS